MDFLKELFNAGPLTWDGFTKAVGDKGLQLADLSTGHYVSKIKHEEELKAKDEQIETLNGSLKTRDDDLADLKSKLETAGGNADDVKKLTEDLQKLQMQYDTDTKAFQKKLDGQKYEFAVREFTSEHTFTSEAAKREFIRAMTEKGLTMEGDKIMGAGEFLEEYKKNNADSFASDDTRRNPRFVDTTKGHQGTETVTKEQFAKMGYTARNELYKTDRELYDKLKEE